MATPGGRASIPRLENGDRLSGAEFMRRYEAMPGIKAELIGGVVYMASPVRHTQHGGPVGLLNLWLGTYVAGRPEESLAFGTDSTVVLDDADRVQPDAYLLRQTVDGQAEIGEDGFIYGPPELVCEVAASTVSLDANAKAEAYEAAGVREYLLWRTEEPRVDWYERSPAGFRPMLPVDGLIESKVFPGLKLDPDALLRGDLPAVLEAIRG